MVAIYLQKENGMEWWKCVAEGEPEIDTTKVSPFQSVLLGQSRSAVMSRLSVYDCTNSAMKRYIISQFG